MPGRAMLRRAGYKGADPPNWEWRTTATLAPLERHGRKASDVTNLTTRFDLHAPVYGDT